MPTTIVSVVAVLGVTSVTQIAATADESGASPLVAFLMNLSGIVAALVVVGLVLVVVMRLLLARHRRGLEHLAVTRDGDGWLMIRGRAAAGAMPEWRRIRCVMRAKYPMVVSVIARDEALEIWALEGKTLHLYSSIPWSSLEFAGRAASRSRDWSSVGLVLAHRSRPVLELTPWGGGWWGSLPLSWAAMAEMDAALARRREGAA